MKKSGILNAELSGALAELGHGDLVTIADCGLPQPAAVHCVDLALVFGVPSFAQVLQSVAAELEIEWAAVATEAYERNRAVPELVLAAVGEPEIVTHQRLKELSRDSRLLIRTGEATPYANVVLRCGVPF